MQKQSILYGSVLVLSLMVIVGCSTKTTTKGMSSEIVLNQNTNAEQERDVSVNEKELLSSEEVDWLESYDADLVGPSFEIINDDLAKDVDYVYSKTYSRDENNDLQPHISIVEQADPATVTLIQEVHPVLFKDQDTLFIKSYLSGFIPIKGIDVSTFQLTQDETTLGEDEHHYVFESTGDEGYLVVKKNTFIKLDDTFAKDDHNIYIAEVYNNGYQVFEGADLTTFQVLEYGYAYDKRTVYAPHILYEGKVMNELEGADQSSFRVLSSRMAIDNNHIYSNGILFNQFQVDIPTFSYSGVPEFFYDKNTAYIFRANSGFRLEDVDIESFEAISSYGGGEGIWWKDDEGVYIGILDDVNEFAGIYELDYGKIDVDPSTFSDLVAEMCSDIQYAKDCQEYDHFYSYEDKNGLYGFPSSKIISHTKGFIPQQIIVIEE